MSEMASNNVASEAEVVQRGSLELTLRRLWRDNASVAAFGVIIAVVLLAMVAPQSLP